MEKLKKHIHDDSNGLDYVLVGDYYIPDLQLPEESRPRDKRLRYMAQAQRAVASFQHWLDETSL